jgi:branched-chain amino acid aminotransferase
MAKLYTKAYWGNKVIPVKNAQVSIASSAVLYGLSVYTVFPILVTKKGRFAFRLPDHYTRLVNSARIIGIDTFENQWTYEKFAKAVAKVSQANKLTERVFVRASVHVTDLVPGTRSRGLKTTLSMFLYEATPIVPQNGTRLKTSVWRRIPDFAIPSRAKVNGAYVNSVLGKQDALDSGYDDCLFLDNLGQVCELSAANIFIVRDGVLITPGPASDILEGINRKTVLELASDMGIPTEEREIDLTELYVADEVFACGTSAFIAPVIEIDARIVGGREQGPLTAKIRTRYEAIMRGRDPLCTNYLTPLA